MRIVCSGLDRRFRNDERLRSLQLLAFDGSLVYLNSFHLAHLLDIAIFYLGCPGLLEFIE